MEGLANIAQGGPQVMTQMPCELPTVIAIPLALALEFAAYFCLFYGLVAIVIKAAKHVSAFVNTDPDAPVNTLEFVGFVITIDAALAVVIAVSLALGKLSMMAYQHGNHGLGFIAAVIIIMAPLWRVLFPEDN